MKLGAVAVTCRAHLTSIAAKPTLTRRPRHAWRRAASATGRLEAHSGTCRLAQGAASRRPTPRSTRRSRTTSTPS
eukprot:357902-Chlamydomonas_euryale.AAC.12